MLDVIIGATTNLLGWSAKDLSLKINEIRQQREKDKIKRYCEQIQLFANQKIINNFLASCYSQQNTINKLKRYFLRIDRQKIGSTIYSTDDDLSIDQPLSEIPSTLLRYPPKTDIPPSAKEYLPIMLERVESLGIKIWNAPTYRILNFRKDGALASFQFSESDFFSYQFTAGLLPYELSDALIKTEGFFEEIIEKVDTYLPIRQALIPTVDSLVDFKSRISIGGSGVVLAMARSAPDNDFIIPLQIRSHKVSDSRNSLAVLPKGIHQHVADIEAEVAIQWTVFRELYEELFGGKEVEKDVAQLKHDWYFDDCPALKYFREHEGAYVIELVSRGVNALAGNYELAILLAVRDTWYWKTFSKELLRMWEINKTIMLSTKDKNQIIQTLYDGNWANESLFHFVEGLIRLKEIDPRRVDLPDMESFLFDK